MTVQDGAGGAGSGITAVRTRQGIDVLEILGILWRRRVPFALSACVVLVGCWFITIGLEPRYTAEASLVVEVSKGQAVEVETVAGGFSSNADVTAALIASEIDMIRSSGLASQVVDQLHLMSDPEFNVFARPHIPGFWGRFFSSKEITLPSVSDERAHRMVVEAVLDNLRVVQHDDSYTISIYFEAGEPVLAARVANAFADRYLSSRLAQKSQAAGRAADWVREKLVELRERVTTTDRAVEAFRKKHEFVDLGGETLTNQQLSRLGDELAAAAAERARAEAALMHVRGSPGANGDVSAPQMSASPVMQALRSQQGAILAEIAQLRGEYGPRHARMLEADRRLAEVRSLIQQETGRVVAELETATRIARGQEEALRAQLDALKATRQDDDIAAIDLRQLEAEARAARSLFDAYLAGLGRASAQVGAVEADARILSPAHPPLYPSYPPRTILTGVSAVLAALAGLAVITLLEMFDRSFRDPSDLQRASGLPVFGLVPLVPRGGDNPDPPELVVDRPTSAFSDAIYAVATLASRNGLGSETPAKVLMVTSSVPGEGKTTLAVALARAVASSGKRVLLIDCDLWRPKVADYLGCSPETGLSELVEGETSVEDALHIDQASGLAFLPTKGPARSPAEICSSNVLKALIQGARDDCELIIIDTPPIGIVSDALMLTDIVDEALLTVQWGRTPRSAVLNATRKLVLSGKPAAAAVFTHVDLKQYARYGYYPTESSETYFRPYAGAAHQTG